MHTVIFDTVLTARVSFLALIITPSAAQQASARGLSMTELWRHPMYVTERARYNQRKLHGSVASSAWRRFPEWGNWSLLGLDNRRRGNWRVVTAHF